MPQETNLVTTQTVAADLAPLYIRDQLLERGKEQLLFARFGMPIELPEGNGKVVQCTRYERLVLPTTPLTEGVTPGNTSMTVSTVQGVVDQWGAVIAITDVAELTANHPQLTQATDLQGDQRAETLDREVQKVLLGGTNVSFANNKASRALLLTTDTLSTTDIRRQLAILRQAGAREYAGGYFRGIIDPFVEQDLNADATFVLASVNQTNTTVGGDGGLVNGMIGRWMGVEWYRSNFLPIITRLTGVTAASDAVAGGETAFATGIRWKVTKLDPRTGVEVSVSDETNTVTTAALAITLTGATTGFGTFRIYSSMDGGAAGMLTFQREIVYTSGATAVYRLIKAGTPSTAATSVVTATGMIPPADVGAGVSIHTSYIFGQGAYGITRLGGLSTTLTPKTATDSDPLSQRRKVGWKQIFKALILNSTFYRRIESASAFANV